jgi:hypothetical protein
MGVLFLSDIVVYCNRNNQFIFLFISFFCMLGEVFQADPTGLFATAFAHLAGCITSVFVTLAVLCFAYRHISLTVAVLAWRKNLYFDHH